MTRFGFLSSNGQLEVRKCNECGQPLPESFEPPADEPWTTGIFGCAEDTESCKYTWGTNYTGPWGKNIIV